MKKRFGEEKCEFLDKHIQLLNEMKSKKEKVLEYIKSENIELLK